ncbi:hypothetical protein Tco_0110252, partial [Tanacetum coccineum]
SMANAEHAPAMASPSVPDDQHRARNRWVPIGKSNCYLNEEKSQPNPIFKIAVDILKQTNFFRAFTAHNNYGAIYIQQFGIYSLLDLKGREPQCYKSFGVLSIEHTSTMLKGCGKSLLNPSTTSQEDKSRLLDAYLEKVAKHQRYIAGEELSYPESPAPKPAKLTKQAKPKATEQPTVSKSKAKNLKDTEEAIMQKVPEESLTDAYPTQRGPLPPVVFRETDTGKFQPLPEVPGKGKEKGSIHRDECEDFDDDKAQEETKKKGKQDSPKPPPGSPPSPPLPPLHHGDQSTGTAAPSSSKTAASAEYSAWTTTDTRIKPSITLISDDLYMDDETTADEQAVSSDDEVGRDHIPTVNLRQSWWKPLTEDRPATPEPAWTIPSSDLSMPTNNWASALKSTHAPPQENSLLAQTGDMATFMDWYCKQRGISELTPKDLEGPAFEIVKVFHHDVIHLQFQMEECHKLLIDQVDDAILRYNVSKPLPLGGEPGHVTIQPDFFFNKDLEYLRYGCKIAEECKYDIAAMYGISHWWFQRQRFYIYQFSSEGDRRAVRTHMRILSVVRIEVFSMYGYNYMKEIVLRQVDLKEYVIAERDFKHIYPSDFEDPYLNLVIRHRVEDFQLGIESYQTQLNLTKPRWEATGFEFKHDYTVIDSPRAVTSVTVRGQMIMRQGLHVRATPERLIARRIFRIYGELCGGTDSGRRWIYRLRERVNREFGVAVEILLKMNLPDHRISYGGNGDTFSSDSNS